MARVDFYLVASGGREGAARVACKVTEKAWRTGFRVYVCATSADEARHIDDLLWTFRRDSFVPHTMAGAADAQDEAVVIGREFTDMAGREMLVNMGTALPDELPPFERIAEVVSDDDDTRAAARQRFGWYRSQGHELKHHDVQP